MKNLVALFVVAIFTVTFVQAVEVQVKTHSGAVEYTGIQMDQDKTEVSISELPADVQTSLRNEMANGWTANKAWKVNGKKGKYFKVELEKDGKTRKMKFNSDGEKMDYDKKKRHKNPPR